MFGEINEIWGVIGLDDTACASFGPVASGALLSVSRDKLFESHRGVGCCAWQKETCAPGPEPGASPFGNCASGACTPGRASCCVQTRTPCALRTDPKLLMSMRGGGEQTAGNHADRRSLRPSLVSSLSRSLSPSVFSFLRPPWQCAPGAHHRHHVFCLPDRCIVQCVQPQQRSSGSRRSAKKPCKV